jgi:hypothetical protein
MKDYVVKAFSTPEELSKYVSPLYIINDYMRSEEDYVDFQEKIYTLIKGCFEHKACREYPVRFKFYATDEETHTLQLRHFVVNVFAWYPFINLYGTKILDSSFIVDCENDIPNFTDYINDKVILVLEEYSIRNTVRNRSVSEVLYNMRRISIDFALIMGLTVSSETFLKVYQENPRMQQIMQTTFPLEMQPAEIEHELNGLMNEEIEIFKGIKDNAVGVILRSGTGIKHKQLSEFTINQGLKPDLNGVTIPVPINSSTMVNGLNKPSAMYIDALGARKSLITNKKVMGKAGYFGKICLLLARTLRLSKTVSDCNTKHLLEIEIKSEKMLKKYNGRYYKLNLNDDLSLINAKRDKGKLVGKKIYLRSPITCACGDEVCHKCFGTTSLLNLDIADGVSGFETEETTKVVNQMVLSTKHLLTTISEKIEFNPDFYRFFSMTAGEINPILNNNEVTDLDNWAVWIDPNTIQKSDELDDDSSFNTYISGKFYVYNMVTKELVEIHTMDEREMFMTDECIDLMKKGRGYIRFKDMDEDTALFELVIMNNELTRPLYRLMDLLNTSKKDSDEKVTYHWMAQTFTELLLESGIGAMALSGELIINRMLRNDPDEDFSRPDFTEDEVPDYQIYTILKALEFNASPLIGLASQNIKKQLMSDDLVTKKHGQSYIDSFFRKTTPTSRLIEMHKSVEKKKKNKNW